MTTTVGELLDELSEYELSAKIWLQPDDAEEGAGLIAITDVRRLGDKIATAGASEEDVVIRFEKS